MNQTPKPSAIVLMASGAVTFLFSFFAFYKISYGFGSSSSNAWSSGLLFIATWPAIFGAVIAGLVAAGTFADFRLPEVLTFTQEQIYVALAIPSLLLMFGFLINDADKGLGFWFMLLGTIGLVAGSIMEILDIGGSGSSGNSGFGQQGQQGPQTF